MQASDLLGVSNRRIFQLAKEPDPPPVDSAGRYPCREFGEWFRAKALKDAGVVKDGDGYVVTAEKARLLFHQANIAAMEEEVKRQNLIPAELVQQHWENMAANTRGKLLNLPGRLAAKVVGAQTLQDAEREAMNLIRETLIELSGNGLP